MDRESQHTERCQKCGQVGAVPTEIRTGIGAGLLRFHLLDGGECVDAEACAERVRRMRWNQATIALEGERATCWLCKADGIIGRELQIAADVLYVKEDVYGEIFDDFKWVHMPGQGCSQS